MELPKLSRGCRPNSFWLKVVKTKTTCEMQFLHRRSIHHSNAVAPWQQHHHIKQHCEGPSQFTRADGWAVRRTCSGRSDANRFCAASDCFWGIQNTCQPSVRKVERKSRQFHNCISVSPSEDSRKSTLELYGTKTFRFSPVTTGAVRQEFQRGCRATRRSTQATQ